MNDYLTELREREQKIHQRLAKLAAKQQILFCALCCERLEPLFRTACHVHGSYSNQLVDCLKRVWEFLDGKEVTNDTWQIDLDRLLSANPYDPDDVKPLWDSLCSHYTRAVYYTINLCKSDIRDAELPKLVSETTVAASSSYVAYVNSATTNRLGAEYHEKINEWVFTSPPVDIELMKQETDIEKIGSIQGKISEQINEMREWNQTFGINPFELGILLEENSG